MLRVRNASAKCHLLWRRLSVTNYSSENNLPMFRLNAPVVIRVKVKRCEQMLLFIAIHCWGYTSSEVKGRWGLSLPPSLSLMTTGAETTFWDSHQFIGFGYKLTSSQGASHLSIPPKGHSWIVFNITRKCHASRRSPKVHRCMGQVLPGLPTADTKLMLQMANAGEK